MLEQDIQILKQYGITDLQIRKIQEHLNSDKTINIKNDERERLRDFIAFNISRDGSYDPDVSGNHGPVLKEKRLDIVMGIPATGKSSAIAEPLSTKHKSVIIDSDMAKLQLPEYNGGYGANAVHEESKLIFNRAFSLALEKGYNIICPIVGKSENSIQELLDVAKKSGYKCHLHLSEVSIESAIDRSIKRFKNNNRFVDPSYIRSIGNKPLENYNKFKELLLFDSYHKVNNDVEFNHPPIEIEYVTRQELMALRKESNINKQELTFREEVDKIKQLSIVDFCDKQGIELKKSGRYYSLKEHDSLVIDTQKNNFVWNSRQKNGDIINFVQEYYNVDFKKAIEIITNKDIKEITSSAYKEYQEKTISPEEIKKSFDSDLVRNKDMRRVYAYLTKTRNISAETVNEFVSKGLIIEDERHNLTFKMKDKEDNIIGVVKKETGYIKLNYINTHSDIKGFSFVTKGKNPDKLFFFEAPLDLMSFYEMNKDKLKNSILVSMQGLKHNCIIENMKYYGINDISVCVDNDTSGKKFINFIKEEFKDSNPKFFIPNSKDWNEDIKLKKETELFNLNTKNLKVEKIGDKYRVVNIDSKKYNEFTNIEDTRRFMLKAKEEYLAKKKTKTKQIQR
jgi:hypothetical protein